MSQIFPSARLERRPLRKDGPNAGSLDENSSSSSDDNNESFHSPAAEEQIDPETATRRESILANVMKQSQWKVKISSTSRRADFSKICSFCLRELRNQRTSGDGNNLIRPCLCVGHRSYHHKRCIEEWIELTGATGCPFCNVLYDFTRNKKSFLNYIRELELQEDFLVNFGIFLFSVYLFLVGLTICYRFVFTKYECDPLAHRNLIDSKSLGEFKDWQDLEKLVDCRRSVSLFERTHSWPSIILFCFTCTSTILLFISIVSLCLRVVIKHYIRYFLWSKTNFKVSVKPYRLIS